MQCSKNILLNRIYKLDIITSFPDFTFYSECNKDFYFVNYSHLMVVLRVWSDCSPIVVVMDLLHWFDTDSSG